MYDFVTKEPLSPLAKIHVTIQKPVGIRNGWAEQPNQPADVAKICELFDRIPMHLGGTREIPNGWKKDRIPLIEQVTQQITWFQKKHNRPVVDGVVDPGQGTLRVMNEVALDTPLAPPAPGPSAPSAGPIATPLPAKVVPPVGDYYVERTETDDFIDPSSIAGSATMRICKVNTSFWRRLVRVENTSINWFGVLASRNGLNLSSAIPHINFTPTPWQGGYLDNGYEGFTSWMKLWHDYTLNIGCHIAAAGVPQILVIPFYRNTQPNSMGSFMQNWKEAVVSAITVAIQDAVPTALPGLYSFNKIETSSFSNGWIAHFNFHRNGREVAAMTRSVYDLDGFAAGCLWVAPNGVTYRNREVPNGKNPEGNIFYVGKRWPTDTANRLGHVYSRDYLLYHGLKLRHP